MGFYSKNNKVWVKERRGERGVGFGLGGNFLAMCLWRDDLQKKTLWKRRFPGQTKLVLGSREKREVEGASAEKNPKRRGETTSIEFLGEN